MHEAVVDVSRQARSIGLPTPCRMSAALLNVKEAAVEGPLSEQAAAVAMGILYWLRKSWPLEGDAPPPARFQTKGGRLDGQELTVTQHEGAILVAPKANSANEESV